VTRRSKIDPPLQHERTAFAEQLEIVVGAEHAERERSDVGEGQRLLVREVLAQNRNLPAS
jgi:hypothetical protein